MNVAVVPVSLAPAVPAAIVKPVACRPCQYFLTPASAPASGVLLSAFQISGSVPTFVHVLPVKLSQTAVPELVSSTSGVSSSNMSSFCVHVGPAGQPPPLVSGPCEQQPAGNVAAVVVPLMMLRKRPSANTMSPKLFAMLLIAHFAWLILLSVLPAFAHAGGPLFVASSIEPDVSRIITTYGLSTVVSARAVPTANHRTISVAAPSHATTCA